MDRRTLLRLLPRLALAWGALTLTVTWLGASGIVMAGPAVEFVVERLLPGFITSVSPNPRSGESGDVMMELQAMHPVPIAGAYMITPWVKMQERISAGHDMVPAIILLAVLLAWPYRSVREGAHALLCGTAVCAVLILWTVSVHFAGLFELSLQRVAEHYHQGRAAPFFLTQMIFFESGGQWLLALLGAFAIGGAVTRTARRSARVATPLARQDQLAGPWV